MRIVHCFIFLLLLATAFAYDTTIEEEIDVEEAEQINTAPAAVQNRAAVGQQYDFDEDEFEGIPVSQEETNQSTADFVSSPPKPHFFYEIAAVFVLAVYAVNYFLGSKANERIVRRWVAEYAPLFREQFAHVGFSEEIGGDGALLLKESPSNFYFYASGRRNCDYCLISFDLQKRQDLFTVLSGFFRPQMDKMCMEVGLDDMEPFIFSLTRNGSFERGNRENNPDLRLCSPVGQKVTGIPDLFSVLSDCPELFVKNPLFSTQITQALTDANEFLCLHVSDLLLVEEDRRQLQGKRPELTQEDCLLGRKGLNLTLRLPPQAQDISKLLKVVFYLADNVPTYKLPPNAKQRTAQRREELKEEKERRQKELLAKQKKPEKREEKKPKKNASKMKVVYG